MAGAINIRLGAVVTDFVAGMNAAGASVTRLTGQINGQLSASYAAAAREQRVFDRGLGQLAGNMQSFGRSASLVTAGIGLMAVTAFQTYAQLNALQLGLQNITGSAELATARFAELKEVAQLPGLGLEEAVQGDVRLRAVGFSAETSKAALLQFGNALALTGGGKFELNSVLTQLTQMGSKARVLSEDLKPILSASPAVAKAIKEMFGTVDSEVISGKLQAAGRGPQDFIADLIAKLSELERVSGGPKNAIENLGDSIKVAQFEFGKAADKTLGLTDTINRLGGFVSGAASAFSAMSPELQGVTLSAFGLAAAIGPLALGIGTLISLGPTFISGFGAMRTAVLALTTGMGPIAIAIIAVVGAFAILGNSIQAYSAGLETSINKSKLFADVNAQVSSSIATETSRLASLVEIAKDETIGKVARLKAIEQINAISPQYLGNITLETINSRSAISAINDYTAALRLKAKAQILDQRGAEADIELEKIKAKSAKDYVDRSRFSGDRIATNVATNPFTFDLERDRSAALDDLGKRRKAAELARAQQTVDEIAKMRKKAFEDGVKNNIDIAPPAAKKPFDYNAIDLGGSAAKKAKAELKALKDEIQSITVTKGIDAVPADKLARVKELKELLKSGIGPKAGNSSSEKQKTPYENATAALSALESKIQDFSFRGIAIPDALLAQYDSLKKKVEAAKNALESMRPVDIGKLTPATSTATDLTAGNAVSSFFANQDGPALPGLGKFQDNVSIRFAELRRDYVAATDTTVEVLRQSRESLKQSGIDLLTGIGEGIGSGGNPLQSALQAIVGFLGDFMVKIGSAMILGGTLLSAAVVAFPFLAPLINIKGPAGVIAGAGLIVGGAAVKGFAATGFANGGLVFGPTLGLVGEGIGTTSSNPEVIAPLDRLKSMIGNTSPAVYIPEQRIEGSTIILAYSRAMAQNESYQ